MLTEENSMDFKKYDFLEDMTQEEMDLWSSQKVGISRFKKEVNLFETKWFDYREAHPLVATCLFVEIYKKKHAQIMRTHGRVDVHRSYYQVGVKRQCYLDMSKSNITAFWKARQNADKYCVPYDYYIETILSIAAERLWERLPRPQHLWQDDLIEIFENKLSKRLLTTFDDSQYSYATVLKEELSQSVTQRCRTIQKEYCFWVINRLKAVPDSKRVLTVVGVVCIQKLIPPAVAEKCFPEEYKEACSYV